jgi:sigma-E factor negative regulatory protein RseA
MQTAERKDLSPAADPSSELLVGLADEALLSAWMDGEECGDYGQSPNDGQQNRQTWDAYHLIGDIMRSPDLAIKTSPAFRNRLTRALDAELPIVAAPKRRSSLRFGLSGIAAAAVVATVVWMAQPFLDGDSASPGTRVADASVSAGSLSTVSADDATLGDYLEAHRQMAGPSAMRQVSLAGGIDR